MNDWQTSTIWLSFSKDSTILKRWSASSSRQAIRFRLSNWSKLSRSCARCSSTQIPGLLPQLQVVADAWFQVFPNNKGIDGKETVQLFIYGNHDMEGYTWGGTISSVGAETAQAQGIGRQAAAAWKQCFKEDYQPIWMKTIKGYHFIGAHWENQNHISGLADFLEEHNSELTADGKPFFYIQHPHPFLLRATSLSLA